MLALFLSSIFLTAGTTHAQVPAFVFVIHAGGTDVVRGLGVAIDSMQNALVTGFFVGTSVFGTNNLTGAGKEDIFVAKYDARGTLLWAAQAGGTNDDVGQAVGVDGAGNCYLTGSYGGPASFGGTNVLSSGTGPSWGAFVAKYDPSGDLVWVRGTPGASGIGVAVDPNGNSYVTGTFVGMVVFGSVALATSGPFDENIFLTKYDADGNVLWAKQAGGTQSDAGQSVTLDNQGNVCLNGFFGNASDNPSLYLAKYDAGGNLLWAGGGGGGTNGWGQGSGVAADASDNLFAAGEFAGAITFSGVPLSSEGLTDMVAAKYNSAGQLLWLRQLGGSNSSAYSASVAADALGNCFVSGGFTKSLTTGLTNLIAVGSQDGFVGKYDANGNLSWVLQVGGGGPNFCLSLASCPGRGIYATGGFSSGTRFGSIALDNVGPSDFFLARIDELPILSVTSTASDVVLSWPTNQVGFALAWAGSLTPPVAWSTNTNPVQVSGDHYTVTDRLSAAAGFYRLSKP